MNNIIKTAILAIEIARCVCNNKHTNIVSVEKAGKSSVLFASGSEIIILFPSPQVEGC